MQVARNFFLSRERSYVRKVYEVLLSWKIEGALTKDQILEIYANQIFLGQRSSDTALCADSVRCFLCPPSQPPSSPPHLLHRQRKNQVFRV